VRRAPQRIEQPNDERGSEDVAPPAGRAAEADEPGRLGRHTVHGDELLLLADGAEEAERVAAEADQRDRAEHDEADCRARKCLQPLARQPRSEHQKRQREPGRDLDRDARDERRRRCANPRARSGAQQQRRREREHDQRVVVRPADREHEQDRVQPDECRRPASRVPEPSGRTRDQRDGGEARDDRDRLERPQAAGQAERCCRVAQQREQRTVRRVLVRPADEREDFVAGGLRGYVCVRVEAVQRAEPGEADVAEDVL
jgi:hypothetical protein